MTSMSQGIRQRDVGMAKALNAAEDRDYEWPAIAYGFLCAYAGINEYFEAWHVTEAAKRMGYAAPTNDKAWGWIFRKAIKEGVMSIAGMGRNPNRHASACLRYKSLMYSQV